MKVLDPGHKYELASFDGGEPVLLTFVKRNDPPEMYPGNEDAYPGTQIQEVLRALIARVRYLQGQTPCAETEVCLGLFRQGLFLLESRHARCHESHLVGIRSLEAIELLPVCRTCGHISCFCEDVDPKPSGSGAGSE